MCDSVNDENGQLIPGAAPCLILQLLDFCLFCSYHVTSIYVFMRLDERLRLGGNKLFPQSSIKCQNQQAGGWMMIHREKKKLPSARSLWSPPCDGERNGGYFKQQARVERCPTACDSCETYRYNTSVGLEMIPMWAAAEEEEEEGRQNFKTLKVIVHDSFM